MCKKFFSIVCLIFAVSFSHAQGYGILADAICWNDGADSSIVRLVLVSSSADQPGFVRYVDQSGSAVDVSSGGSFSYGYCCCNGGGGGGGNVTRAFQVEDLRGLLVQTVGSVDSVGIDVFPLPINLTPTEESAYVIVWDSITNENVRVPMSAFPGSGTVYTVNNGLTENPANNFQLGGTLIQNTLIDDSTGTFALNTLNLRQIRFDSLNDEWRAQTIVGGNRQATGIVDVANCYFEIKDFGENTLSRVNVQQAGKLDLELNSISPSVPLSGIQLDRDTLRLLTRDVIANNIHTGQFVVATDVDGEINYRGDYGEESTTTDASGDITITYDSLNTPTYISAQVTGTTAYVTTVHTITGTTFKIRVFEISGGAFSPVAMGTSVTIKWMTI